MALRTNHYDVAFEAYLRARRTPYVAVDETRRALLADASLKSLDFIVYSQGPCNLLVDVKGRRFPSAAPEGGAGHCWENWATRDDLEGLLRWQEVFGGGFRSLLVFAYDLVDGRWASRHAQTWEFRRRSYSFYGVWAEDYAAGMTERSRRWSTVTLPAAVYRRLRTPLDELLGLPGGEAQGRRGEGKGDRQPDFEGNEFWTAIPVAC
jgi:hypothetical protein